MFERDPFDIFYTYNMPVDFSRVDNKTIEKLNSELPDIGCTNFSILPDHINNGNEPWEKRLWMIGRRAEQCKWGIITASVLYTFLEDLARKFSTPGLVTGHITEEGFQKLVMAAGEEHEKGHGGPSEFNYMSDRFGREVVQALNAIPALWDHLSYAIAEFYQIGTDRCDIWRVVNSHKVKANLRQLREHIRFNDGKNPYEKVLRIRNRDQHREDVSSDVYKSMFGMADANIFEKEEARVKEYLNHIGEGYKHFVKGYRIMIDQMNKDAREMKDGEIFGK